VKVRFDLERIANRGENGKSTKKREGRLPCGRKVPLSLRDGAVRRTDGSSWKEGQNWTKKNSNFEKNGR